ncbi:MAG: hypothetical protein ACOY0T_38435 [Myxococcota bacterium]
MVALSNAWIGRHASVLSLPFACLQLGCADVLDIPSDPQVVDTGPWRCVGSTPSELTASAQEAEVRVRTCDFITDCTLDVTGLTAKLCDKRDVGCLQPRLTGLADINGEFRFRVPTAGGGFQGYLRVDSSVAYCTDSDAFGEVAGPVLCGTTSPQCDLQAPDARCNVKMFATAMMFFNPPIVRDVEQPLPLQMFPTAGLPSVITAAGIQLEPGRGSLFLQALDCDGRPAAGISFKVVEHPTVVRSLYVDNGVVSGTAMHTDASGIGGFISVPPGFVTVVGYRDDGVAVGEMGLQAAIGVLTYGTLFPTSKARP